MAKGPSGGRSRGRKGTAAAEAPKVATGRALLEEAEKLAGGEQLSLADIEGESRRQRMKDFADAVTLWTNGHVPAVRDPNEWKFVSEVPNSKIGGEIPDSIFRTIGTKQNYEKASRIMTQIANAKVRKKDRGDVFRGMALSRDTVDSLKPGGTFDLRNVASFSYSQGVAHSWAKGKITSEKPVAVRFDIKAKNVKRGSNITVFSNFKSEDEFVSGGKVKILGTRVDPDGVLVVEAAHI